MADLLNSCKDFKKNYSARHNKICEMLCIKLTGLWRAVFLDKTANTSFEELNLKLPAELGSSRSDMVLCGNNIVIIADVACPCDLYADELYKSKMEKYADLVNFVSRTYNCVFLPTITGSCGFVHHKTLNSLVKLGLSKRRATME